MGLQQCRAKLSKKTSEADPIVSPRYGAQLRVELVAVARDAIATRLETWAYSTPVTHAPGREAENEDHGGRGEGISMASAPCAGSQGTGRRKASGDAAIARGNSGLDLDHQKGDVVGQLGAVGELTDSMMQGIDDIAGAARTVRAHDFEGPLDVEARAVRR